MLDLHIQREIRSFELLVLHVPNGGWRWAERVEYKDCLGHCTIGLPIIHWILGDNKLSRGGVHLHGAELFIQPIIGGMGVYHHLDRAKGKHGAWPHIALRTVPNAASIPKAPIAQVRHLSSDCDRLAPAR